MNPKFKVATTKRVFLKISEKSNETSLFVVENKKHRRVCVSQQPVARPRPPSSSKGTSRQRPQRANVITPELITDRSGTTPQKFPRMNRRAKRTVLKENQLLPSANVHQRIQSDRKPMQEVSNRGRTVFSQHRVKPEVDLSMLLPRTPTKEGPDICNPYELQENRQIIVRKSSSIRRTYLPKQYNGRGKFSKDIDTTLVTRLGTPDSMESKRIVSNNSWLGNMGNLEVEESLVQPFKEIPGVDSKSHTPAILSTSRTKSKSRWGALSKNFRLNRIHISSDTQRRSVSQMGRPKPPLHAKPTTLNTSDVTEIDEWITQLEKIIQYINSQMGNYQHLHLVIQFSCYLWVLFYYTVYFIYRIIAHKNDGREKRSTAIVRQQYLKRVLIILLIISNLFIAVSPIFGGYSQLGFIIRTAYYSLNVFWWIMSFSMLTFEYARRIWMSWYGQRSYWIVAFLFNMVLEGQEIYYGIEGDDISNNTKLVTAKTAVWGFQMILTFILTLYAIFKPNDFYPMPSESMIQRVSQRFSSFDMEEKMSSDVHTLNTQLIAKLKVKFDEPKTKLVDNTMVVLYRLIVYVNHEVSSNLRKSYQEIQDMDTQFRRINSLVDPLPKVTRLSSVDKRMQSLESYFNVLCKPENINIVLLEFLGLENREREMLINASQIFLSKYENYSQTQSNYKASITETYWNPDSSTMEQTNQISQNSGNTESQQTYFKVRAYEVLDFKDFIVYQFKISSSSYNKVIEKRYSDFYDLYEELKSIFAPAIPPELPAKNRMRSIFKRRDDPEFINRRREGLEQFLIQLLNDPAYHVQKVMDFIDLENLDICDLWGQIPQVTYYFPEPMEWIVAYEESRPYQIYNFNVAKYQGSTRQSTWAVYKRYSEFRELHHQLESRFQSPILAHFYRHVEVEWDRVVPEIPPRDGEMFSHSEIEVRKKGLERYLKKLFQIPYISECIAFKIFINERAD